MQRAEDRMKAGPYEAALGRTALFLDFDGTLVDIQADPQAIEVPEENRRLLASLAGALGGAMAILSGRSLEALDRFLGEGPWDVAALHGLDRRRMGRFTSLAEASLDEALGRARAALARRAGRDGFEVEDKGRSIALHFRRRPESGAAAGEFARRAVAEAPGVLRVQTGKLVVEIAPAVAGKGDALRAFMSEPPYLGRLPVMIGDDDTDEHAFAAAQEFGGLGVKVGDGPTIAARRLPSPAALGALLGETLETGRLRLP